MNEPTEREKQIAREHACRLEEQVRLLLSNREVLSLMSPEDIALLTSLLARYILAAIQLATASPSEDTKRLDWLEAHAINHWTYGDQLDIRAKLKAAAGFFITKPTIRNAIDAATASPSVTPEDRSV